MTEIQTSKQADWRWTALKWFDCFGYWIFGFEYYLEFGYWDLRFKVRFK
jgi:hypothetical protein